MKKTVIFLSAALLIVCINAQVEPTDTDSDGARNVSTLDHLRWISENSNSWSSNFELDNDIDAATTSSWNYYTDIVGFKPIGLGFLSNFEGTFDGKGYKISNLYISSSVTGLPVGMFSTTDNATIQGLTISNGNVSSDNAGSAMLIGKSNNTIVNNCSVSGTTNGNSKALVLAETLDDATDKFLDNDKSPSRKVGELDNRGSHFYLALYWAEELAKQDKNDALKAEFTSIAKSLRDNETKIIAELNEIQGKSVDIAGYFKPNEDLVVKAMRPNTILNSILG